MSENNLFMIEAIDDEKNIVSLANYIFRKKYDVEVSDTQIKRYSSAFDRALNDNMYLSVEFDEERGEIIG